MEKSQLKAEVREVSDEQEDEHGSVDAVENIRWQPGYAKQFPAIGAAALLVLVLTAVGCALVLCLSNERSSSQWSSTFRPNVALSVLTVVGNIALVTALSQGIPIAWWVKAVHGATVSQLHESWRCSNGFLGLAQNLFRLDIIGVAVLVAKISVLDSILYQRATTTYVGQDTPRIVPMLGAAATTFPSTGYVVAEGFSAQTQCNCFMIGDEYTPVVNTWQTSNGFFKGYNRYFQQCNGVCYTSIDAIGFEIDCNTNISDTDIAVAPIQAFNAAGGAGNGSAAWTDIPIFNSSFAVAYATGEDSNQSVIVLDLQYFQSSDPYNPSGKTCHGAVTTVQCKLRPALVRYPITVTNFTNPHVTNGVSLGRSVDETSNAYNFMDLNQSIPRYSADLKQAEGFQVLSYLYPNETRKLHSISYLGGVANALHLALTSTATISYQGQGAWALSQAGVLAQTMMYGPPNMGSCDCSFRDESLPTIIASINQLAFLTSTGMIGPESMPSSATSTSNFSFFSSATTASSTVSTSTPLLIQGVASNSTTFFRSLHGTVQISDVNFYKTHFLFLGLGIAMTILCAATTTALFWRYGTLGREVSMGPIEIAGAFGAPILSSTTPDNSSGADNATSLAESRIPRATSGNASPGSAPMSPSATVQTPTAATTFADLNHLLATVGGRRVMYGYVDVEGNERQAISDEASDTPLPLRSPTLSDGSNPAFRKRASQYLAFGDAAGGIVRPASMIFPTNG